jgi:putative tricarboxylic transport membrane protein
MNVFGVVGYIIRKYEYEEAPLILAFVLGPMLENSFTQAMIIGNGDFTYFIRRPISATLLAFAGVLIVSTCIGFVRTGRKRVTEQLESDL